MLGCSNDAVKKTLVDCPLCILTYFFAKVKSIYDSLYSIT